MYLLTSNRKYKLRVDLEDFDGQKRYAEYSTFSISSSADLYRLKVAVYSGDAGRLYVTQVMHVIQQYTLSYGIIIRYDRPTRDSGIQGRSQKDISGLAI